MSLIYSNNLSTPRYAYRQILKIGDISTVLGNTIAENNRLSYAVSKGFTGIQLYGLYDVFGTSLESDLATFISKARNIYGLKTVGCIMGLGNSGFISALAYNGTVVSNSRFDDFNKENEFWNYFRVDFTILNAVIGSNYTIVLNGISYGYTAVFGDTNTSIAASLQGLCSASGLDCSVSFSAPNVIVIKDLTSIYSSFTYSSTSNIDSQNVNETYTSWINSLIWLKANIGSNGTISAYVANPANNWGVTEAGQICTNVEYYEGTNYTQTPNATQNSYRNRQLVYIAQGAANVGKVQKHYPIFSAESLTNPTPCGSATYMGTYLQTNGITTAQTTWKAQYNADPIPNKVNLYASGYSYFSYNCLSLYVP